MNEKHIFLTNVLTAFQYNFHNFIAAWHEHEYGEYGIQAGRLAGWLAGEMIYFLTTTKWSVWIRISTCKAIRKGKKKQNIFEENFNIKSITDWICNQFVVEINVKKKKKFS